VTLTKLEKTTIIFLAAALILGIVLIFVQNNRIKQQNRRTQEAIKAVQALTPRNKPEKSAKGIEKPEDNRDKVNVNTATIERLDKVPGLSKAMAEKIVQFRMEQGKIKDLSELLAIKGMTPRKLSNFSDYLCTEGGSTIGTPENKLNLNFATQQELEMLPGVTEKLARSIIDTRIKKGSFHSLDDLQDVPGLTERTFRKFENLVEVK